MGDASHCYLLSEVNLSWPYPVGSFSKKHTLNTVLWLLLQRDRVKLSDNPHFYPKIQNYSEDRSIKPWAFTQTLAKLEKLEDLQDSVISRWQSHRPQYSPPKQHAKQTKFTIHTLMDDGDRVIFKSNSGNFYKNIGNVWTTTQSKMTILKGMRLWWCLMTIYLWDQMFAEFCSPSSQFRAASRNRTSISMSAGLQSQWKWTSCRSGTNGN